MCADACHTLCQRPPTCSRRSPISVTSPATQRGIPPARVAEIRALGDILCRRVRSCTAHRTTPARSPHEPLHYGITSTLLFNSGASSGNGRQAGHATVTFTPRASGPAAASRTRAYTSYRPSRKDTRQHGRAGYAVSIGPGTALMLPHLPPPTTLPATYYSVWQVTWWRDDGYRNLFTYGLGSFCSSTFCVTNAGNA